jgi:hypothetical protein
MIIEKRAARLPDWNYSSLTGLFGRRLPDDVGGWVREDDNPPIRLLFDLGGAVHLADRFTPAFSRRWEAYSLPTFEVSDELTEDGAKVEQYGIGVPVWSPQIGGLHMLVVRGAYAKAAVSDLVILAEGTPEAADGDIPVVDWLGSNEIVAKRGPGKGRKYYSPQLVTVGWMPRLESFGPRLNPVPKRVEPMTFDTLRLPAPRIATIDDVPPPLAVEPVKAPTPRPPRKPARVSSVGTEPRQLGGGDTLDDLIPFGPSVL